MKNGTVSSGKSSSRTANDLLRIVKRASVGLVERDQIDRGFLFVFEEFVVLEYHL